MYLNIWKLVVRAHLPSLSTITTEDMSQIYEVKGAAIDASASESDTPISACFRAPQSLAPSPHIPTSVLQQFWSCSTSFALSSGDILAQIYALNRTCLRTTAESGSFKRQWKALPVSATEYSSGGCCQGQSSKLTKSFTDLSSSSFEAIDYDMLFLTPGLLCSSSKNS